LKLRPAIRTMSAHIYLHVDIVAARANLMFR
jgi:hypothetical protein